MFPGQELGLEQVCLRPAYSVWVLDFMQEIFHDMTPGDFESMLTKAEDSETRKGLGQKKRQERAGSGFGSLQMLQEGNEPMRGCLGSLESQRKGGLEDMFRRLAWDELCRVSGGSLGS